jgi:hypothetical protein
MKIQAYLTAAAINLKRLAAALLALLLRWIVPSSPLAFLRSRRGAGFDVRAGDMADRCVESTWRPLLQRPHGASLHRDTVPHGGKRLLQPRCAAVWQAWVPVGRGTSGARRAGYASGAGLAG